MGLFGVETLAQVLQDIGQGLGGHLAFVLAEDLDKSTHMCALEVMRQVHRHRNGGHCREGFAVTVGYLDGIAQI